VPPVLILGLIALGMFSGWIAHLLVGGNRPVDWGQCLLAGFVGSFVGGLLASLIAGDGLALRPSGLIGSIVGAAIVILIWNAVRPAHKPQPQTGRTRSSRSARSSKTTKRR
jgi:uncharacterized membrane protein YeaQ/YmgE (transglycosylase-associated protein family)